MRVIALINIDAYSSFDVTIFHAVDASCVVRVDSNVFVFQFLWDEYER